MGGYNYLLYSCSTSGCKSCTCQIRTCSISHTWGGYAYIVVVYLAYTSKYMYTITVSKETGYENAHIMTEQYIIIQPAYHQ